MTTGCQLSLTPQERHPRPRAEVTAPAWRSSISIVRRDVRSPSATPEIGAVSYRMSIRAAAIRPTDEGQTAGIVPGKGADNAEHRPVSPGTTCGAREGVSGVPRRGRDGQMASAE